MPRLLRVRDRYEYDVEEKRAAFCAEAEDPDAVVLRFLGTKGHMTFGHPYGYAKQLNPACLPSVRNRGRPWAGRSSILAVPGLPRRSMG